MKKKTAKRLHPEIKRELGYDQEMPDNEVLRHWKSLATRVCKPCWELRYCPYGPLVEQFPLLPTTRDSAIQHNEYLTSCVRTGQLADGSPLTSSKRKLFKKWIKEFNPAAHPESIPAVIAETQCTVFGHICPVVYSAEGFTETSEDRRTGRYIPFRTKIRVVRRDNYTCQHCGRHLQDNEVEFDHVIPIAKGGSSDEHNIRLTCHNCNADKSDKVEI
jgi:hypothetical protein